MHQRWSDIPVEFRGKIAEVPQPSFVVPFAELEQCTIENAKNIAKCRV